MPYRNRMKEKSSKLGKINELRLDPVKEDTSDLDSDCQVICSLPSRTRFVFSLVYLEGSISKNHFLVLQLILTSIRGMVREFSICGQGH